jgi:hypothetical protein
MHLPATRGAISADNSGGCGSLIRNGEAGGEYPDAVTGCGGNAPEVVSTVTLGLAGVAGSGNKGPGTIGNASLGLSGTLKRN